MNQIDLTFIASRLESFEETIISKLIDRAQYSINQVAYERGNSGFENENHRCLMDLRLFYQEEMDSLFGRFCVPEERPFNKNLTPAGRRVATGHTILCIDEFNRVNLTSKITPRYMELIRCICPDGDDGQYGSSTEHDVYSLQAISRRVHFGAMYVAECKYRSAPTTYQNLIAQNDRNGLLKQLTRPEVEEKIVERILEKTTALQTCSDSRTRNIIQPESMAKLFKDTIIPLTKEGEILYLLNRKQDRCT